MGHGYGHVAHGGEPAKAAAGQRVPPHDADAEGAVLGAILLDRDAFDKASEAVTSEDFYSDAHRRIFACMVKLAAASSAIDLVTVTADLRAAGDLAQAGGAGYVSELADRAITSANVEYYAGIVRQHALLRRLAAVTAEIATRCFEPQPNLGGFLDEAERGVLAVAEKRNRTRFVHAGSLLPEAFRRIEELYERQDLITGVPSGYPDLDRMTAGFQRGNLVIVAGRPSVGKTAFCLNVAEFAAIERGIGVAIFSLEMSREELVFRLLCSQAEVSLSGLRTGRLRKEEFVRLANGAARIERAPIYIDDTATLTPLELRGRARRLARERDVNLGMVVLDYLQLVHSPLANETRERQIADVSRSLKALAKELELPVVALSQLNRESERNAREPRLSDLRDSGSIEQDADVVMFLHRMAEQDPTNRDVVQVKLAVAKQRNGPVGEVDLVFRPALTRFETPYPPEPITDDCS